ncbi:MAG: porin [Nitrospinae bacterium]|nr:porin [Nitrospinota bacterium]
MERIGVFFALIVLLLLMFIPAVSFAEEAEIKEMKRRIEVLTEEMEKLKLGAVAEPKYESFMGLGPAASKVYGVEKGLSIGGYGEVVYYNYQHLSKKDFANVARFILYGGYKFNDWIIMNTEIEFEHAGIGNSGSKEPEVYTEFSYLDFLLNKSFNLRTGLILMPIGIINEYHEPTVYHGVIRPDIETNIIPGTWRDIGIMAYGNLGSLKYDVALVNGPRANSFTNSTWMRSGRQQGAKVNADALASLVRINYEPLTDLLIGGTYYSGKADEGKGGDEDKSTDREGTINLWEVHAQYQLKGLHLRGLYTRGSLDANDAFKSDTSLKKVGREVEGWYVETAYDIMSFIKSGSEMSLSPFVRYEAYDTNKDVFNGQTRDKTLDRTVVTYGIGFKPHPNVVIKADYQSRDTSSSLSEGKGTNLDENKIDQFNIGVGFIF